MSNQPKKSSLGAARAILAAAVAIVKMIGAVYKIPSAISSAVRGKTYFDVGYRIYNILC